MSGGRTLLSCLILLSGDTLDEVPLPTKGAALSSNPSKEAGYGEREIESVGKNSKYERDDDPDLGVVRCASGPFDVSLVVFRTYICGKDYCHNACYGAAKDCHDYRPYKISRRHGLGRELSL